MICPGCNKETTNTRFCSHCGFKLSGNRQNAGSGATGTIPPVADLLSNTQSMPANVTSETQPLPTNVTSETQPLPTNVTSHTQPLPTNVTSHTQPLPTNVTSNSQQNGSYNPQNSWGNNQQSGSYNPQNSWGNNQQSGSYNPQNSWGNEQQTRNVPPKKSGSKKGIIIVLVAIIAVFLIATVISGLDLINGIDDYTDEYVDKDDDYDDVDYGDEENPAGALVGILTEDSSDSEDEADADYETAEEEEEFFIPEIEELEPEVNFNDEGIHTYELVVSDLSWTDAYEECLLKGGHLVRINSDEEFEYILTQIKYEGKEKIKFWLGGYRDLNDNYRWVYNDNYDTRGSKVFGDEILESDYKYSKYWLDGEPSLYDPDTDSYENRMNMFYVKSKNRWVWNDVTDDVMSVAGAYYSGSMGYICEYE